MKAGCLYLAGEYERSGRVCDEALAVSHPAGWQWRAKSLFLFRRREEALESLIYDLGAFTFPSPKQSQSEPEPFGRDTVKRAWQAHSVTF